MKKNIFYITILIFFFNSSHIYGSDNNITSNKSKVITGNVLDEFSSENIDENICKSFEIQNRNKSYDIGYKKGKEIVKTYIAKMLLKYDKQLNILFPIESMYIENILEPPYIIEVKGEHVLENGSEYRVYDKQYKIVQKSKFVDSSSKKNWKTFLLDDKPSIYLNRSIDSNFTIDLKLTDNEECNSRIIEISKKSFKRGLKDGKEEAILLYKSRLKLLYKYMDSLYLYHRLYIEKKLDPPIVGKINTAVSSDGKSLTIDENFYKILEYAKFNDDVKKWKIYVIEHAKLKEIK